MKIYLTNKIIFELSGKASDFLKGLSSNDPDRPRNAFLDRAGKIVVTFDQVKIKKDVFLIAVERPFSERTQNHLKMYLKLNKTFLKETVFHAYFDLDGTYAPKAGEYSIPQKKGALILSEDDLNPNVTEGEFTLFRLRHNIPLQGIDYDQEMLLNVSEDDYVSYTKGCYLGQEIIARVHYKSKPPQKLCVLSANECPENLRGQMTSSHGLASDDIKGFVFLPTKSG